MRCGNCGAENVQGASFCAVCGAPLSPAYAQQAAEPPSWGGRPQTSGMAIASLVLGICGLFIPILAPLIGLILGIVALGQIGGSRGRQTGSGLAIAGICVSALMLLIMPAMLFPVFMRARQSARKVQCLSNMKNLAVALQMYMADWDGAGSPAMSTADTWCDTLDEYVKNRDVYRCPSARGLDCGFALNSELGFTPVAGVADSGRAVAIFESDQGWNAIGGRETLVPEPRHLGGDNWGYMDGHAKWWPRGGAGDALQWELEQGGF